MAGSTLPHRQPAAGQLAMVQTHWVRYELAKATRPWRSASMAMATQGDKIPRCRFGQSRRQGPVFTQGTLEKKKKKKGPPRCCSNRADIAVHSPQGPAHRTCLRFDPCCITEREDPAMPLWSNAKHSGQEPWPHWRGEAVWWAAAPLRRLPQLVTNFPHLVFRMCVQMSSPGWRNSMPASTTA